MAGRAFAGFMLVWLLALVAWPERHIGIPPLIAETSTKMLARLSEEMDQPQRSLYIGRSPTGPGLRVFWRDASLSVLTDLLTD